MPTTYLDPLWPDADGRKVEIRDANSVTRAKIDWDALGVGDEARLALAGDAGTVRAELSSEDGTGTLTLGDAGLASDALVASAINATSVQLDLYGTTILFRAFPLTTTPVRQFARVCYAYRYSFAALGGVVGTISLGGSQLPNNFIAMQAVFDLQVALTGVGASAALTTGQAAGDMVVATSIAIAPWSTTGRKDTLLANTAASSTKMTADRQPALVVSGANLTAGVFNLFIEGWLSP